MYVCTIWTRSREFPDVKRTRDAGNSPFGVTARRGMYIYIYRRRAGLAFYIRAACVENKTPFRAVGSALLSVCVKTRARMLRVCIYSYARGVCAALLDFYPASGVEKQSSRSFGAATSKKCHLSARVHIYKLLCGDMWSNRERFSSTMGHIGA